MFRKELRQFYELVSGSTFRYPAELLGMIKVLVSPKGAILGCQIVGANAGELIHE